MPVDHEQLTALFTEAMDLDQPAQHALIQRVHATDPALAGELAALLDADGVIVTALRTAGLKATDVGAAFRRRTAVEPAQLAIPNYEIQRQLGEGGMGVVYAAEQLDFPKPVAIKVLHVASPEALARFRAEAAIMQTLDHPGIARVFGSGDADQHPFIVMERIDGVTLDVHAAQQGVRERIALVANICDAVHYAHERGVIHRDLKPANIMVRATGGIAVLDFGVARAAESSGRTQAGDFLGTPLYMSPEQALGRPDEIDRRTDIYSLGIVLFELVAGAPPYELRGLALPAAVRIITTKPPRALGHDEALDAIAARTLAKRREDRPASAEELAAALRRYLWTTR